MKSDDILPGSKIPVNIFLTEDCSSPIDHSSSLLRCNESNKNVTKTIMTTRTPEKRSSSSIYCRICHDDSGMEELIDPCECSGTLALIHASCLEKWLSTSNTEHCEICKHSFYIERKNKSIFKSVLLWGTSTNGHGTRGIAGDAISLAVLTPLCIVATYLCGIGALAYARLGFWESTGLAILCCMLVVTYSLWFFVTIRFHYKSWQEWRGRNQDIKLLVKHCTEEERKLARSSVGMSITRNSHDQSNDRSAIRIMRPRENNFASWFSANFLHTNDPLFVLQQTTFV